MPAPRSTCSRSTCSRSIWLACAAASLCLAACSETARLSVRDGMGPDPQLPAPVQGLVPTVNVADASGWPPDTTPVASPGFAVGAFATGLQHPRWLYRLPNGDVLVADPEPGEHVFRVADRHAVRERHEDHLVAAVRLAVPGAVLADQRAVGELRHQLAVVEGEPERRGV